MVRIAPNWAHLRGTVVSVRDTGDPSGFLEVSVRVTEIGSLPRTRNMFEQEPGQVVGVLMSRPLVERLDVRDGVELEADVRRADLHRSFVHPERIRVGSAGTGGDESTEGSSPPGAETAPGGASAVTDDPAVTDGLASSGHAERDGGPVRAVREDR